jgi:hypothetical protein
LVDDNESFELFENLDYRPRLRTTNAAFQQLNDTTYRVHLTGLTEKRSLTLLQRFDDRWRLFPQPNPTGRWCKEEATFSGGLMQCSRGRGQRVLRAFPAVRTGPTLTAKHTQALGYANRWELDPDSVRSQLPPNYFVANPRGGIDLELLVSFRPQIYFDLGVLVTGLATVLLLGYVGLPLVRRRIRILGRPGPKASRV